MYRILNVIKRNKIDPNSIYRENARTRATCSPTINKGAKSCRKDAAPFSFGLGVV